MIALLTTLIGTAAAADDEISFELGWIGAPETSSSSFRFHLPGCVPQRAPTLPTGSIGRSDAWSHMRNFQSACSTCAYSATRPARSICPARQWPLSRSNSTSIGASVYRRQ